MYTIKLHLILRLHEYDGAAHAKLKVFVNDKEYESSSFDHGNPPIEIKSLVEYIMTMSKSKDGN